MIKIGELNFYLAEELADKLNLKIATIRGFIRQNKLKAKKIGRKNYILEEDFLNFMSKKINYNGDVLEKYWSLAEATTTLYNHLEKNKEKENIKQIYDLINKSQFKDIFIELKHCLEVIDILINASTAMDIYGDKFNEKIESVREYIYMFYEYKNHIEIKEISKFIEKDAKVKEMCQNIEKEMDAIVICHKIDDLEHSKIIKNFNPEIIRKNIIK